MPIHIENMTTDITVLDGELPLNEKQIDRLTEIILQRLERKQRDARQARESTLVSNSTEPAHGE